MHPAKFFEEVKFSTMDGWASYDNTDEVIEELTSIHPSQVIFGRIKFPLWQIKFGYTTKRGNYREHIRYMFSSADDEADMLVEMEFNSYVESFNNANPHRGMENVQILSITPVANAILEIQ